jgi:hypothetical protein
MKSAVLVLDGAVQVMLSPENDVDKQVLSYIAPDCEIEAMWYRGSYYEGPFGHVDRAGGMFPNTCHGGWYRAFKQDDCRMLVIRQKDGEAA